MEQKKTYNFKIDIGYQTAELEQRILCLCSGCADAIAAVGEMKNAIAIEDWVTAERNAEWLKSWLARGHDVANTLTIVKSYVEFKQVNGEEKGRQSH